MNEIICLGNILVPNVGGLLSVLWVLSMDYGVLVLGSPLSVMKGP